MDRAAQLRLIATTPPFFLLSHYIAVFCHEYAHSFMAWLLGFKQNPLLLHFGDLSLSSIFFLTHIDENVNYDLLYSLDYRKSIALIAFAGPATNALLYLISLFFLKKEIIIRNIYYFYFIFFFAIMNLGNLYDYVPVRTFSIQGDISHIVIGLNISPWLVYFIGGYIVAFLIWHFFSKILITTYFNLKISLTTLQAMLMILSVATLFGFFAVPGLWSAHGSISFFVSVTSVLAIPGLIIALWPTREWVKNKLEAYK